MAEPENIGIYCVIIGFIAGLMLLFYMLLHYKKLSETDETTSIQNYRGFRMGFKMMKLLYQKKGIPSSLVLLDIDNFRKYNVESYAFGDAVLKTFVESLQQQLPKESKLARFKFGDEFIIHLPLCEKDASEKIKEIQQNIAEQTFYFAPNQSYGISFSFGTVSCDLSEDTLENLILQAEEKLKNSKLTQLSKG